MHRVGEARAQCGRDLWQSTSRYAAMKTVILPHYLILPPPKNLRDITCLLFDITLGIISELMVGQLALSVTVTQGHIRKTRDISFTMTSVDKAFCY